MKKLLSLLFCLAIFLPVMAYAEPATDEELYTIDCGDFTIGLYADDFYEIAPEKTNNAVYAVFYPAYDETSVTHDNFNVVWNEDDASSAIALYGAESYAALVLQASKAQFKTLGIEMTDEQVLSAVVEDNVCVFVTCANMDYAGAGYDLVTPLYQLQAYFCDAEYGTYIFTFSAVSIETLENLSVYLDYITFK